MNNSPRKKFLAICIGTALVQMASFPALADSAVGVDTVSGNAANPGYASSGPLQLDPDSPVILRTPTGQMYSYPSLKDEIVKGRVEGKIEAGLIYNSDQKRNSKRNEYADTNQSGLIVNNFKLSADSDAARYFTVNGGAVGRKDQYYDVTTGKYNSWKVRAFYNETQHVFTDTWKSLYNGEGTGNLTTGLPMPVMITSGAGNAAGVYTPTSGSTLPYAGAATACTAALPCWQYNGTVYGNAVALAAINGITGTPNSVTGAIPLGVIGTTGANGATNAAQSNMAAAIAAKLAATNYSELKLVRKKGGVRGDMTLSDGIKVYASYSLEKRVGARPFAMNDGNATSTDIAEPIDYNTHDFLAGLSYRDELNQANMRFSTSMFRNNISTLNMQYAMLGANTANGVMQHATFDLTPDNDAYNLKGEFARSLPDLWKGRFTAAASWGSNRQNDALLAPLSEAQSADLAAAGVTTLTGANPGYANNTAQVSNWNTTNALSRKNAGQRIDNKLVDLGLSLRPGEDLGVKASYRFYETDNKGGYIAYNPLTGQFGRGPTNGTAGFDAVVAPSGTGTGCYTQPGFPTVAGCSAATLANGSNVPVYGQARSTRQYNYGISADYDLTQTSSLNGAIEREDFHRNFRERDKTGENKVKLGYVNRALGDATLRVSYEKDTKRGSAYRYRTFEDLGTGLPGLDPATQIGVLNGTITPPAGVTYPALNVNLFNRYSYYFRKYDLANRDQKILNTRLNYMATAELDVGLNMQVKRADYPEGIYGLKKDNQDSVGVDMSFQPTFERIVTAFYNYQKGNKVMMMNSGIVSSATSAAAACTLANLNTYGYAACSDTTNGINGSRPDGARWASDTTDYNSVLGIGLQEDFGFMRLGVDYSFARSSTHIAYNFGPAAFVAPSATVSAANAALYTADAAAIAGSALPDMTTVQNTFTLNLVKPLDKKTTVRAMYRYEGLRVTDWHYDGVIVNKVAAFEGGGLLLDAGPLNYHVNTIGIFVNYKL